MKCAVILLAGLWLLMCALELFVWRRDIRLFLFAENPAIEISVSLLNDLIWVPLGLTLPLYIIYMIFKGSRNYFLRLSSCLLGSGTLVLALMHLDGYFKYLLYLIIPFIALYFYHVIHTRPLRIHVIVYMLALCGLFIHYKIQLIPKLSFLQSSSVSTFTVLTYNIQTYQPIKNQIKCVKFVEKANADIVFIQEMDGNLRNVIRSRLSKYYPYQLWSDKSYDYTGGLILSRFPFITRSNIQLGTIFSRGQSNLNHATIQFHGQEIHLYNCHLFHGAHLFLDLVRQEKNRQVRWQKFLEASNRHQGEAMQIATRVQEQQAPVILVGDFNNTPNSYVYQLFSRTMQNAYACAGWGLGGTYGHKSVYSLVLPRLRFLIFDFLRIDHIFCSHDFKVLSAQVFQVEGSDHRPMLVQIRLNNTIDR